MIFGNSRGVFRVDERVCLLIRKSGTRELGVSYVGYDEQRKSIPPPMDWQASRTSGSKQKAGLEQETRLRRIRACRAEGQARCRVTGGDV